MIEPRRHLKDFERPSQPYETRINSLRLDYNETVPYLPGSLYEDLISRIRPDHLTAYPEMNLIYRNLARSLDIEEDQIVITAGSDGGIRQVLETFCSEGDEVIISYPTYGMYTGYSEIMNLNCKKVNYNSDFSIDYLAFFNEITDKTKVIAIANPNGNIGSIIPGDELEMIIVEAYKRNIIVLLDQAYHEYYPDHWENKINEYTNIVIVRTFSKAWGIAGLRLGYILTNSRLRSYIYKTKPVVETNSIAVLAGNLLLENRATIEAFTLDTLEGKEYLARELESAGFKVYRGFANFIQVDFGQQKETILKRLYEANILVKDNGETGVLGGYVRITVGPKYYMEKVVGHIMEVNK